MIGWPLPGARRVWAVVLVVVIGLGVWQVLQLRDARDADAQRDAVRDVATAQVLDLTTLDSASIVEKLDAMAARTSGEFTNQIDSIAATFVQMVQEQTIAATGSIDASAITEMTDKDATVVVASSASVSEGEAAPTQRTYRLRITLERVESDWKITGMEFVQ